METERKEGSTDIYSKAQLKNILQELPGCEQTKRGDLKFQNYRSTATETE
jgi:hypothetical protein